MTSEPLLRVEDLVKRFRVPGGVIEAVSGVGFTLERGRTLGLVVGSTGALVALSVHLMVDYPIRNPVLMITAWSVTGLLLAAGAERMAGPGDGVAAEAAEPVPAAGHTAGAAENTAGAAR